MNIRDKVIDLIRNEETSLPTLPVIINNIIVTAKSDKTTANDLAQFISNDQALSARVLRIANSPYYGQPKTIDSITRAIIVVGFKEIISIALGSGIFKTLNHEHEDVLMDMNELWKHSIGVGFAARFIEKKSNTTMQESTMLMGLLHDIGKILFIIHFPDEYGRTLERHQTMPDAPLHILEKEFLGIDHAEMAYLLMKQWNFPDTIIQPVRFHHDLLTCPFEYITMAMTVNMANFICHESDIGQSGDLGVEKPVEIMNGLGIAEETMGMLVEKMKSEKENVDNFLEALS